MTLITGVETIKWQTMAAG